MKRLFLNFSLVGLCMAFVSCSNENEPKIDRKIRINVYESASSKESGFYDPKPCLYYKAMLFSVNASDIDKTKVANLENETVLLKNGESAKALFVSNTGVFYDVPFGAYTILVYCTENPFNAYLEHRFMFKQFAYNKSTALLTLDCCFVYEDMKTNGGWYAWTTK